MDANHSQVIRTLRSAGWHVHDTSALGGGWVDCVAARKGQIRLIEIKDGSKKPSARALTEDEKAVHAAFDRASVEICIIESIEQAARLE